MRISGLLVFLIGLHCTLSGQKQGQALIDSLTGLLPVMQEDTNKVKALIKIADEYSYMDAVKGAQFSEQAVELANRLDWLKGRAQAYNVLGINYETKSDYPKALEAYFTSLKLNEEAGNKRGQAGALSNIGGIYSNMMHDYSKAVQYFEQALRINQANGYKDFQAINLCNIGAAYGEMKRYDEAIEKYREALPICRESHDLGTEILVLINVSQNYTAKNDHVKAVEFGEQCLESAKMLGDQYWLATSVAYLGDTYLSGVKDTTPAAVFPPGWSMEKALQKSVDCLKEGFKRAGEMGELNLQMLTQKGLSEAYEYQGNFKESLACFRQYAQLQDSIFSNENKLKITNLETQRELDVREKQIELDRLAVEKKRNERVYFIAGILALLLVIGIVVRSFFIQKRNNRLLNEEKQRSDNLLLNILPEETAEELKRYGFAKARRYDLVSVLFADFQNFTQFSERVSPEELVQQIDYCYKAFDEIIERFGLEKIKTIGDAYMAAGGLPKANTTNAADTVGAALAIREFIQSYKAEREAAGKPLLDIRIGIHTGPVVAGVVGHKKFAYDLWGDTVNTAARMESSGEVGQVNISESTFALLNGQFNCVSRGKIEAKHKGMLEMYFVTE